MSSTIKKMSIIAYAIGAATLLVSCFTTGVAITWFLGILSVAILSAGCVLQIYSKPVVAKKCMMVPIRNNVSMNNVASSPKRL